MAALAGDDDEDPGGVLEEDDNGNRKPERAVRLADCRTGASVMSKIKMKLDGSFETEHEHNHLQASARSSLPAPP